LVFSSRMPDWKALHRTLLPDKPRNCRPKECPGAHRISAILLTLLDRAPAFETHLVIAHCQTARCDDVGLTMKFAPFSEIAEWASSLTEEKLAVATYDEEAREVSDVAIKSAAHHLNIVSGSEIQAAGAFPITDPAAAAAQITVTTASGSGHLNSLAAVTPIGQAAFGARIDVTMDIQDGVLRYSLGKTQMNPLPELVSGIGYPYPPQEQKKNGERTAMSAAN
jgi:hypothetical protein